MNHNQNVYLQFTSLFNYKHAQLKIYFSFAFNYLNTLIITPLLNMQKLYKVAFQRILQKVGADKVDNLTLQTLQNLLKQKNIPLSEIDETIFHKIPRQELKNLFRNPCPVNKADQTSSQIVSSAKMVRGALNIVEKRICFKCPFVGTCEKAFLQPSSDFKVQNPLENLLLSMKNVSELESPNFYKPRSWISGVRINDSLNSVLDDLIQGGQELKIFKEQRILLKQEAEAENQNSKDNDEKQLLKQAKKQRVPLKDVYAQVPSSKKEQQSAQKQGQQTFQQLSKGPQNIFKKKKSDQFIKIAQKYLNEEKVESDKKIKDQRKQKSSQKRRKYSGDQDQNEGEVQQRRGGYNNKREMRGQQQKERYTKNRQDYRRQDDYEKKFDNKQRRSNSNYRRQDRQSEYDNYQPKKYDRNNRDQPSRNYQRDQPSRNYQRDNKPNQRQRNNYEDEESNPKIRRLSKEKPYQQKNYQATQQQGSYQKKNNQKLDKFFSQMREQKTDEQQILSGFNKRQSQSRSSKLPKDAKYSAQQKRGSSMEFSENEMRQFDRLERVPKILKTEFASKQDIQERQQQSMQESSERKGRRVKRV